MVLVLRTKRLRMLQCPEYSATARILVGFGILSVHRFGQFLSLNVIDPKIAVWELTIGNLDCLFVVRSSLNQPKPPRLWMTSQLLEVPD